MFEINRITIQDLPSANTTYSQAIKVGDFVFVSGQTGMDYKMGRFVGSDITSQTQQLFENTKKILEAAGSSLNKVIRVMIYIIDKEDIQPMNEVFARYITSQPVKTLAVVSSLFGEAKVEMEFTALV